MGENPGNYCRRHGRFRSLFEDDELVENTIYQSRRNARVETPHFFSFHLFVEKKEERKEGGKKIVVSKTERIQTIRKNCTFCPFSIYPLRLFSTSSSFSFRSPAKNLYIQS